MLTACSQAVSRLVWHIPLLCVQWKTPDDGQKNCPKHVEFYFKNTFEKLVHLVGFIIRMYLCWHVIALPCCLSCMQGLMIEKLINPQHVACAADWESKLCSTEILLFFSTKAMSFKWRLPSGFPPNLWIFLFSHMHVACPSHFIPFDLFILLIHGKENNSWVPTRCSSTSCTFSSPVGQIIFPTPCP